MNFLVVCLHGLDMRDFHSQLRNTPFLDKLCSESVFIPHSRAQGHNQKDSLNAEITGKWTARLCNSKLTEEGYYPPDRFKLSKTVMEYLEEGGYDIFTCMRSTANIGTAAVTGGMIHEWLKEEPGRLRYFSCSPEYPKKLSKDKFMGYIKEAIKNNKKFYGHIFLRETHRPWNQAEGLYAMLGYGLDFKGVENTAEFYCARKAALKMPDEFAALRRRGLTMADEEVKKIFDLIKDRGDTIFIVYSNHGEVFDHFRYHMPYKNDKRGNLVGTSHGPYPYEVLYSNMQIWKIPGQKPKIIMGMGRLVDFTPTILDLAGITHEPMDGESMIPYFEQGEFPYRERFAENTQAMSMVREDSYKLISTGAEPYHLRIDCHKLAVFDLKSDPYEYVNLINTPQGQEVLQWAIKKHKSLKE